MNSLNEKLKDIYLTFKDDTNSKLPLDDIKEYLKICGVSLDEKNTK